MSLSFFSSRVAVAAMLLLVTALARAGDITVSAAASLTHAFNAVAQRYEAQHPGVRVWLNFGASGVLLQQMARGAPVDVFASADQETMDQAAAKGLIVRTERKDFVRNTLVLVVPANRTRSLQQLTDLQAPHITRLALGNPASVPVGRYAQQALQKAGLWDVLVPKMILAQNVRQALDYVSRTEVDAALVYATDALSKKEKVQIAFEVPLDQAITYPIAPTIASPQADEARRFIAFVLSAEAQQILVQHGFQKP